MHKKIEGIIVSEFPFEESSKIIKVFTSTGIISIIAKGAMKIKSPFFSSTSKLSYGTFNIIYKENKLSTLVESSITNDYRSIKKDIIKISYATYLTELILGVSKHEHNSNIYSLYISSLDKINDNYDPLIITSIIRLKMLDYLGIKPVIDRCISCGNTTDIVTISSYLGGLVCKNCRKNEVLVSSKTIQLIRILYYIDIDKITKIDISDDIKKEIDNFINDYYERYSGIYLKSKILLDTIK